MKRRTSLLSRFSGICLALCGAVFLSVSADTADAQSYRISPGDMLRIEVLEDPSLNRSVLVAPDGRISVPSIGTIQAGGLSVDTVRRTVINQLTPNFASPPNVFVAIEGLTERVQRELSTPRTITVFVLGETAGPGQLQVEPGINVMQMFATMGGFTKFAATKRIQLRRTDPRDNSERIYRLNYDAIEAGAASGRTVLQDGDVIVVPQRRLFE